MQDVDLTLVPRAGESPFGFSPANYYRQMVAGFSVLQPDRSLVAHVPSYKAGASLQAVPRPGPGGL